MHDFAYRTEVEQKDNGNVSISVNIFQLFCLIFLQIRQKHRKK